MSTQNDSTDCLTNLADKDVVQYLFQNADFFQKYPDLLTELKIPHETGQAVSLVERQVEVLREKNQEISKRLHEMIEIARQNEELARRMHQLVLTLMDAGDIRDIFPTLYDNLRKNFHADRVITRLFAEPAFIDMESGEEFVGKDHEMYHLFAALIKQRQPLCGRLKHQQQVFLFGDDGQDIQSAVMVPLRGESWSGILAIGSHDEARFQPGMGVELLANLGEVLSFILKPWISD